MTARNEEDAESGILRITMGGRPYRLPVLTIDQSEQWQDDLSRTMAGLDIDMPEDTDGAASIKAILTEGNRAMVAALLAYDVDEVLGGETNVRKKMTRAEVHAAMEVIAEAEFPFEGDAGHSVVEAFGLPLRVLGAATRMTAQTGRVSPRARSANGRSTSGASPTPTSDDGGRPSNSSSDGSTDTAALVETLRSG